MTVDPAGTTAPPQVADCVKSNITGIGTLSPGNPAVLAALLEMLKSNEASLLDVAIDTLKDRREKGAVAALRELAKTAKNKIVQQGAKDAADTIEGK